MPLNRYNETYSGRIDMPLNITFIPEDICLESLRGIIAMWAI